MTFEAVDDGVPFAYGRGEWPSPTWMRIKPCSWIGGKPSWRRKQKSSPMKGDGDEDQAASPSCRQEWLYR
jgi:hypothetical protein